MKSKILIILLCVVAAIFLISGCFFYNTIYITFPLAATYIAIMVSNYALVMFGLAVILHYEDMGELRAIVLSVGVFDKVSEIKETLNGVRNSMKNKSM